ncbi:MAG TPA: hypothetical protein VG650_10120 [Mycobacteriales bacterium]|nr:hypothetical protein [Mycobacteriales bacterium]
MAHPYRRGILIAALALPLWSGLATSASADGSAVPANRLLSYQLGNQRHDTIRLTVLRTGVGRIVDTEKPATYHFSLSMKMMQRLHAEIRAAHVATLPSRYPPSKQPIACGTGPQILKVHDHRIFVPYGVQPKQRPLRRLLNTLLHITDRKDPVPTPGAHLTARPTERCGGGSRS